MMRRRLNLVRPDGDFDIQYKVSRFPDGQGYEIYKDPATDDGTKKSLKGMVWVNEDFTVETQCTLDREKSGMLQVIYQDGKFYNQTTLTQVRERIVALSELKAETEA